MQKYLLNQKGLYPKKHIDAGSILYKNEETSGASGPACLPLVFFYNIINNIKKQCIIVTKDFITSGKVRTKDLEGLDCPIYRIKKAEGFDPNNMATIRTTIERIK